jgi:hypothetical protein
MLIAGAELLSREQMMQITGGFSWLDGSDGSGPPDCFGDDCSGGEGGCATECECVTLDDGSTCMA